MQDLLSENVDLQAHQIEEIQETIISSTEHIREGNEQVSTLQYNENHWDTFYLRLTIVYNSFV